MSEKCVCHLNGFRIKDGIARQEIDKLKKSVYATPQMYGAVGDGITDDTTAIFNCLDENECVFFPKGTYLITEHLALYDRCNHIFGESKNDTKLYFKIHEYQPSIRFIQSTGSISDLTITNYLIDEEFEGVNSIGNEVVVIHDGSSNIIFNNVLFENVNGYPIQTYGVESNIDLVTINNCEFRNIKRGLMLTSEGDLNLRNVNITNCIFDHCNKSGITIAGENINIENCYFKFCSNAILIDGITNHLGENDGTLNHSKCITINNNKFENIESFYINVTGMMDSTVDCLSVINNTGKDYSSPCLFINSNDDTRVTTSIDETWIHNVIFRNNHFVSEIVVPIVVGGFALQGDSEFYITGIEGKHLYKDNEYVQGMGNAKVYSNHFLKYEPILDSSVSSGDFNSFHQAQPGGGFSLEYTGEGIIQTTIKNVMSLNFHYNCISLGASTEYPGISGYRIDFYGAGIEDKFINNTFTSSTGDISINIPESLTSLDLSENDVDFVTITVYLNDDKWLLRVSDMKKLCMCLPN